MEDYKTLVIKGRPIKDLAEERAPSYRQDEVGRALKLYAKEYKVGDIVPTIQYLISGNPISEKFWRTANYISLEFEYKGETIRLFTNHGSEGTLEGIIDEKIDPSDAIVDLFKLSPLAFGTEKPEGRQAYSKFKKEIEEKTSRGIELTILKDYP